MSSGLLPQSFYARDTLTVARELLGCCLVRVFPEGYGDELDGARLVGKIIETEAYVGESDLGCHAKAGKTKRTQIMYGPPGRAYVYFTYGMHWMLNAVTQADGFPAAVLIRAIEVEAGLGVVEARRAKAKRADWTNGPAKLTLAFGIDSHQNGIDLTSTSSGLWIEPGVVISDSSVTIGPRVGLYNVPEPWKSMPWRFLVRR
ncbi:MAG: DNA-3-methyladenine glycosylase [Chloroflexi bacterium]|nr:DNA-3-methyladenine glycosylase [Chloroflexota bacterium]